MELEILDIEPTKKAEEKEIFDMPDIEEANKKPKKKRQISEAQRLALAKGRARVKANREAKKKAEEEAKKQKEKEERLATKKAKQIEREQKQKQKQLKEEQEKKKIRLREEKMLADFNSLKSQCLKNCKAEDFEKVDKMLQNYISREDILKGNEHVQDKVGLLILSADKKYLNKK